MTAAVTRDRFSVAPEPVAHGAAAISDVYDALHSAYGGAVWHWMPDVARGPMDIVVGAILVQHTTWSNAERALASLREAAALDVSVLAHMPEEEIARLVRVSGTPTVKAKRLRALCQTIERGGGIYAFLAQPAASLRSALLATHGVGPETADSVALYAGAKTVFVIDAYTRRLFGRVGFRTRPDTYDGWQAWFQSALPPEDRGALDVYRRYHAYIVLHAKALCRATPLCAPCPLLDRCVEGRARIAASGTTRRSCL